MSATRGAAGPADDLDLDRGRAGAYRLLGSLLRAAPCKDLLAQLARLESNASQMGHAQAALAAAAARTDAVAVEREFFALFIGVGRGELLPYASYYLTGFLHERPLARVREDLAALGIERAEAASEPEDHLGVLCEVMAGLVDGSLASDGAAARRFFTRQLASWSARVFADLAAAKSASFYRAVAVFGAAFIDIETEGFALPD